MRRRWRLVVALTVIFAVIGAAVAAGRNGPHTASATIIVRTPGSASVFGTLSERATSPARHVADQAAILSSTPVASRALEILDETHPDHGNDVGGVRDHREIIADSDSNVIDVRFTHPERGVAIAGVNALITAYEENADSRRADYAGAIAQLDESIAETRATIESLQQTIDQLTAAAGLQPSPERDLAADRRAEAVTRESSLVTRRDELVVDAELDGATIDWISRTTASRGDDTPLLLGLLAGLILGGALGVALAYWLRPLRRRVVDGREVEPVLRAPTIATIPPFDTSLPVVTEELSAASDALWSLSRVLEPPTGDAGPERTTPGQGRVVAFVSAQPDRHRTLVALNVAAAISLTGRPVVLVSAQTRGDNLAQILLADGVEPATRDLVDILHDPPITRWAAQAGPFAQAPMLDTIACRAREKSPRDLFASARFADVIERLASHYVAVVVDVPAVTDEPHAADVIRQADRTVAVVTHHTPLHSLRSLRGHLDLHGLMLESCVYASTLPPPPWRDSDHAGPVPTDPLSWGWRVKDTARPDAPTAPQT